MKSLILIILIFCSYGYAANSGSYAGSYANQCALRKQNLAHVTEITKANCFAIRDSKQCKDFYKTLEDDKDKSKQRTCSDKEIESKVNGNYLGEAALGCAMGVIVDPFVELGTDIGEGIAKAQIAWEKADECNKSMEQKQAIIMNYNLDVPKLLQFQMPTKEKLKQYSCAKINSALQQHKRVNSIQLNYNLKDKYNSAAGKKSLSADELEFMDYNKLLTDDLASKRQGGIVKMIEKVINDLNLKLDCYTPAQALAIRCEIAANIGALAIPGVGALRMARLAKLTKVRIGAIEKSLAELQAIGKEARIAKATNEIASLSQSEKIAKLESELGRAGKPLSKKEIDAIDKSHLEGANRGEAYGSYTGDTLREKKRILMKEGGFTEVEADFMINRGYVGNAPDAVIAAVQEAPQWSFLSTATKGRAKQVFGRDINSNEAASILGYKNALNNTTSVREKLLTEAKQRMSDMGLSEKEIKSITSGDFESSRAVASSTTPSATTTAKVIEKPAPSVAVKPAAETAPPPAAAPQAPATNPFLKQAESNFNTDPVYNLNGKVLKESEAKKAIDGAGNGKFASDTDRAIYVADSFQEDVAHIQKMSQKARDATTAAEKQKYEATVQVYAKRCKSWAALYQQAGYSNSNVIGNFQKEIGRWCN